MSRIPILATLLASLLTNTSAASREITSLDFDWRFHRGDIPGSQWESAVHDSDVQISSPIHPAFDDSAWRRVDVPHDYFVEPDRKTIAANGVEISLAVVRVGGDAGRTVPTGSCEVVFTVTGSGRLLGVGNGDPSSHESDKSSRRSLFNGQCLAILQASPSPGKITFRAQSAGLRPATTTIRVR
jgi:hypothetical protein